MSDATVRVTFTELLGALDAFGDKLSPTVAVAVRASIEAMIRDVVRNRMNDRARYIGVVTGAGRRSVQGSGSVRAFPDHVEGSFGSSLGYIRAHERGFNGRVQVKAHQRRISSRSGRSQSAREVRAALRTGGRTSAYVRAHSRLMNIRAKHFLADTLAAGAPGVERRVLNALIHLARTGKVPALRDVAVGGGGA